MEHRGAMAWFSENLTCSICITVFTEPVTLLCGHSFCRECICVSLDKRPTCPLCRAPVDMRGQYLLNSLILKSLVEKTREAAKHKLQYMKDKETGQWMCPEHDEKLKLFCVTDQQLICVVCREAQTHDSHKCKPVSEAAALVKAELEILVQNMCADTSDLEVLAQTQREEVNRTKLRSLELKVLISNKFKTMYTFLIQKKEALINQVKCDEEEGLKRMTKTLRDMEEAIAENKKLKSTVTLALEIQDSECFLKTWFAEEGATGSFRPKKGDFQVEKTDLFLGPYESHMQMFVWKEMIQVVEPREEQLLLQIDKTSLAVSQDKCSALVCHYQKGSNPTFSDTRKGNHHKLSNATLSVNLLGGQHYWEVYLALQSDWEVGISQCVLKKFNNKYFICALGHATALTVEGEFRRIGIYLNCPRKELSFYNAETMTELYTASLGATIFPVPAYFRLGNQPHNPLTIWRY